MVEEEGDELCWLVRTARGIRERPVKDMAVRGCTRSYASIILAVSDDFKKDSLMGCEEVMLQDGQSTKIGKGTAAVTNDSRRFSDSFLPYPVIRPTLMPLAIPQGLLQYLYTGEPEEHCLDNGGIKIDLQNLHQAARRAFTGNDHVHDGDRIARPTTEKARMTTIGCEGV